MLRFQTAHFQVIDECRSGLPTSTTAEDKSNSAHHSREISTKFITETLGISYRRVGHIIHIFLDMRKVSAKWVPKCLNENQKYIKVTTSKVYFGAVFSGRCWFSGTISPHGWNLASSLWSPRPNNNQWSDTIAVYHVLRGFKPRRQLERFWLQYLGYKDGILFIEYLLKVQNVYVRWTAWNFEEQCTSIHST